MIESLAEAPVAPIQVPVSPRGELKPVGTAAQMRRPLSVRISTLAIILIPLAAVIAAPLFVWGWGFRWTDLGVLVGMYVLTGIGITVGFHRLIGHRSFETYTWLKFVFTVLGSMACQGPLFHWVAQHRRHHQHSDTPEDPHTPHHHGSGLAGWLRGFMHAHIGWFFRPVPDNLRRYIKDLRESRALRIASMLFPVWVALGLIIPAVIGGVITLSWTGVWTALIWGGLVRLFLVHHVTWSVNSACHLWGGQPFRTADESRNNVILGVLAMGEGWHNAHHAFPTSARHGLRWWQFDLSYCIIRTLAAMGLAWRVRVPSMQAQLRERRVG
jgi:stearoyl-CoA desaturase (delta-9 desaturase)